jgi:hypothetical protein
MKYTIKSLVWQNHTPDGSWFAASPSSPIGYLYIDLDDGLWWAAWDMSLAGTDDLESLKRAGQEHHNQWVKKFLQPEVEPWADRMGGQFTAEEIADAERDGW